MDQGKRNLNRYSLPQSTARDHQHRRYGYGGALDHSTYTGGCIRLAGDHSLVIRA